MVNGFRKENKNKIELFKDAKQLVILVVAIVVFVLAMMNMFKQLKSNNSTADVMNTGDTPIAMNTTDSTVLSQEAQNILQKTEELKQEIQDVEESSQIVSDIDILPSKALSSREKVVSIEVDNSINRVNPFLPTENPSVSSRYSAPNGLPPKIKYPVDIVAPPLREGVSKEASDLMLSTVSGIMYDSVSPSAVVKIQGTDYFVKKGDVIKGFKILNITKDFVYMQYGKNTYYGYVGQLLAQAKADLDYTKNISNLNSKFGGSDVTISVRK